MSWLSQLGERGWAIFEPSPKAAELVGRALAMLPRLFALPDEVKRRCTHPESNFEVGWRQPNRADRPAEVWQLRRDRPLLCWPAELSDDGALVSAALDAVLGEVAPGFD